MKIHIIPSCCKQSFLGVIRLLPVKIRALRIIRGTHKSTYFYFVFLLKGEIKNSPEAKLTRGEFLVMLMKAFGIAPDTNREDNFSDAGSTWYTGYLAAAKRLGISGGAGNNMFAPGKEITRQEMFTLLYNALKVLNQLPQGNAGKPMSTFGDADKIAFWAKDAMKLLVETGTIGGSGGNLSPADTATRAEMTQILYNLLFYGTNGAI